MCECVCGLGVLWEGNKILSYYDKQTAKLLVILEIIVFSSC